MKLHYLTKEKQIKAKQSKENQSKTNQSKSKQNKAKQNKAKQSETNMHIITEVHFLSQYECYIQLSDNSNLCSNLWCRGKSLQHVCTLVDIVVFFLVKDKDILIFIMYMYFFSRRATAMSCKNNFFLSFKTSRFQR